MPHPAMNSTLPADLFELMHELLHLYRARMRSAMEGIHAELTFNEVRSLMYVGRHPGRTQSALVEHSHADKAQMARMLAQLEARGWLERRPDPADRRVRRLHLGAPGQALFDQISQARQRIAAELLQDCPAEQQATLQALLLQVRDRAQAVPAAPEAGCEKAC